MVSNTNLMSKKTILGTIFKDNFGYQNPPMANFHGIYHRNCSPRYVGVVLVLRKLGFRGFKGQFDVKKANFRGLIAKIGHYWPIQLPEPTYSPFLQSMPQKLSPKVRWRGSSSKKVKFWGSQRSIRYKKDQFQEFIAKMSHYRPILATTTHLLPILMEYVIGIVP